MSKKSKAAQDYSRATPQLVKQVKAVLADADAHKYSVSRVYAAYNAVFAKRDQPQTCSSCLRNRVRELRAWAKGLPQDEAQGTAPVVSAASGTEVSPGYIEAEFQAVMTELGNAPIEQRLEAVEKFGERYKDVMTPQQNADFEKSLAEARANVKASQADPNAPGHDAPAEGVTRFPMGDGFLPIDFTPSAEDESKGTVLYADGSKVKAGTYATPTGHEIAVQPGGKATIKHEDLT